MLALQERKFAMSEVDVLLSIRLKRFAIRHQNGAVMFIDDDAVAALGEHDILAQERPLAAHTFALKPSVHGHRFDLLHRIELTVAPGSEHLHLSTLRRVKVLQDRVLA